MRDEVPSHSMAVHLDPDSQSFSAPSDFLSESQFSQDISPKNESNEVIKEQGGYDGVSQRSKYNKEIAKSGQINKKQSHLEESAHSRLEYGEGKMIGSGKVKSGGSEGGTKDQGVNVKVVR